VDDSFPFYRRVLKATQNSQFRQRSRQTDRQAGRQAGRQTDRQTDRQAGRQADRQTDRQAGRQAGRQTDRQAIGSNRLICVFSVRFALKSTILYFSQVPRITDYKQTPMQGRKCYISVLTDLPHAVNRTQPIVRAGHGKLKPVAWNILNYHYYFTTAAYHLPHKHVFLSTNS